MKNMNLLVWLKRDEMKRPDTNQKDTLDNFHAWYNTVGNLYIDDVKTAWNVFYTIMAHDWKHYDAD